MFFFYVFRLPEASCTRLGWIGNKASLDRERGAERRGCIAAAAGKCGGGWLRAAAGLRGAFVKRWCPCWEGAEETGEFRGGEGEITRTFEGIIFPHTRRNHHGIYSPPGLGGFVVLGGS